MKKITLRSKVKIYIALAIAMQIFIVVVFIAYHDIIVVGINPSLWSIQDMEWLTDQNELNTVISKIENITPVISVVKTSMLILNASFWTIIWKEASWVKRKYWWIILLLLMSLIIYIYIVRNCIQYHRIYIPEDIFTVSSLTFALLILRKTSRDMTNV